MKAFLSSFSILVNSFGRFFSNIENLFNIQKAGKSRKLCETDGKQVSRIVECYKSIVVIKYFSKSFQIVPAVFSFHTIQKRME